MEDQERESLHRTLDYLMKSRRELERSDFGQTLISVALLESLADSLPDPNGFLGHLEVVLERFLGRTRLDQSLPEGDRDNAVNVIKTFLTVVAKTRRQRSGLS